jgi:hypothetical protein
VSVRVACPSGLALVTSRGPSWAAVLLFLYAFPDFPQFVKGHDMSALRVEQK